MQIRKISQCSRLGRDFKTKMAAPMSHGISNVHLLKMFCYRVEKLLKCCSNSNVGLVRTYASSHRRREAEQSESNEEFRVLNLEREIQDPMRRRQDQRKTIASKPPRYEQMRVDQDWTNVWPTASTFKYSAVPLPIRQGALKRKSEGKGDGLPLEKYGNTELIKIPNFLHLTDNHIKKHCEQLKQFCTPWPKELESDEDMKYHFPVEVITSDYCFSSPSIRDPRARAVTIKFHLDNLQLDYHARDKYIRLVGDRYNRDTGEVTLMADRCPVRKQNYDYLQYVMTALYFESWKVEDWESEKTEDDMERYFWDMSASRGNIVTLLKTCHTMEKASGLPEEGQQLSYLPEEVTDDTVIPLEPVQQYKAAVEGLHNTGETEVAVDKYKESVLKLFNIKSWTEKSPDTSMGGGSGAV